MRRTRSAAAPPAGTEQLETAPPADVKLARRLARELRPFWLQITVLLLVGMLATPLALLTPVPLKIVIDSVLGSAPVPAAVAPVLPTGPDTALLVAAALMMVAVALLTQMQDLAASVTRVYTGEKLVLRLRTRLFRHLQRLSVSYHDLRGTTDSTYRIQYDATAIQGIATDTLPSFVTASVTLVAMLAVTMAIDVQLGLVALGVVPILLVASWYYRRRLRRQSRRVKKLESGAMSLVQEALAAARVVQAFGREDHEEKRFTREFHESMWARVRYTVASSGYGVVIGMTVACGTAAVLFVGVRHVQSEAITLGDLVLIMSYLAQLYAPLKTMSKKAGALQGYLAGAERVFALLDEEPDVKERAGARPLTRARGEVVFEDVGFGYDPARPVLEQVSLTVPPGTRVGVAGATGGGKTTCVSLLNRFYDPTSGRILLDGVDLRDYRLADLRNQFAIVLQEPLLFSASIGENIAYARPEASVDEIVAAAVAAGAHEFITALPDGYDTRVGERGSRLSGGERQRISLARAFLKDAPVLILDEPTSAVDTRTEEKIMEAMDRLMRGRTTFLIAHRLSTLRSCDQRVELTGGRVVQAAGGGADIRGGQLIREVAPTARSAPTTGEIRAAVAQVLRGQHPGRTVCDIERTDAVMASSYPAELVTVTLDNGQRLVLFLKDLSSRRYDTDLAQRRSREIAVYRDVLPAAGLGTARYYASVQDPDRDRHWLLLEHVDGECLRYLPFEMWVHAAAWLGRLQAHVAHHPDLLTRCAPLQAVTLEQYVAVSSAAGRAVAAYGEAWQRRLARALAGYTELAERMATQPRTFAHGSYRPQNIVIAGAPAPPERPDASTAPRVCPLDWETATLAPGGYDLAYLSDGFDDDRREVLAAAYRAEAVRCGVTVPEGPEAYVLSYGYDIHKNLRTLSKAVDRGFPPDGVDKLVAMVEGAAARALRDGSARLRRVA